jgi:uncharacterized protein (TIGR03067 family)
MWIAANRNYCDRGCGAGESRGWAEHFFREVSAMALIRAVFGVVFVVAMPVSWLLAEEPKAAAKEKLDGVWVAEQVLSAGRAVPSEKFPFELHFAEGQLTFKFVGKNTAGKDRVHDLSVDASKSPATIDITRTVRGKKSTVLGIYKFEDGKLFICSLRDSGGNPSTDRPRTFESSRDIKSELMILKRKRDDAKP